MSETTMARAAWTTTQPEQAGFAPGLTAKLDAGVASGLLRHLHGVLVARGGALVLERYWDGPDEHWGRPLGHVSFGPETLHDLRSVTKGIVGLLYGIALDRGLVAPPEAPLLPAFPEYPDLAADPARMRLTIGHALTMTLGLEWDEIERPYTDPANSEIAMENAPDRYRFILERPVVAEPGTRWTYSGGAVALIGALIARGVDKPLPEFAREALFEPLGIATVDWTAGEDGVASAASGLRLKPRDLLRVGATAAAGGVFDGKQVVSKEWLARSFTRAAPSFEGLDYGYLWFLGHGPAPAFPTPQRWVGAFGNGGQRLWVMPEAGLSLVVMSGNYNSPTSWVSPLRIWREIVLANMTGPAHIA
jgi:CubicO group peptidase (beta-lactamase class C family)